MKRQRFKFLTSVHRLPHAAEKGDDDDTTRTCRLITTLLAHGRAII